MPIYSYACVVCGHKHDVVKSIADLDRMERCLKCEYPMQRQICAPAVVGDYAGYECPITGKWIEGRRAHEENLKKHNCRVLEPGETEQVSRYHQRAEQQFDKAVEATAEEFIEKLPTQKREKLVAEVEHGIDAAVTRTSLSAN